MLSKKLTFGSMMASTISLVTAFQPPSVNLHSKTALHVAVDPTTVSKKEYEDICGVAFDEDGLMKRLHSTSYLYPKHVEVIEDIAPIAGEMVDSVVSPYLRTDGECVKDVLFWFVYLFIGRQPPYADTMVSVDSIPTCCVCCDLHPWNLTHPSLLSLSS